MNEQSRAEKCNNGASQWVCFDCAEKYRTREPYGGTVTIHNDECYICKKFKMVGPSRKLFGLYISV